MRRVRFLLAAVIVSAACAPYENRPPDDAPADAGGGDAGEAPVDAGDDDDDDAGFVAHDAGFAPVADAGFADGGMQEMRGLWITRFAWNTQAGLEGILDRAAAAGFNAVFVQIRATGDAYYASSLEPWSARLGALGRDPGWDPLAVAVARGHALGMEVHAYFNVFSAWTATGDVPMAEGDVQHPLFDHPEWLAVTSSGQNQDTEYRWFSPANPEVRAHIAAVAREILESYDVDGLHLDRIRTAGADYSHDAVAEDEYDARKLLEPTLTYGQFMDDAVTAMVADLYDVVVEVRPEAALSAAVWGIHTRLPGCSTSQGKADYHQDSYAWAQQGVIDALVPMTYWAIDDGACTDWRALTQAHVDGAGERHVWAGHHALEGGDFDAAGMRDRIEEARALGAAGTVLFASSYLDGATGDWDVFAADAGPWSEPAAVPPFPWRP